MYTPRIDFDVHAFIKDTMPTCFTVTELTKAYFESPKTQHTEFKSARQYIYRQLQDLVKHNILTSGKGNDGKSTVYVVNETSLSASRIVEPDTTSFPGESSNKVMTELLEKIKVNKLELLTSMGETEAYREWAEMADDVTDDIKDLYKASRDNTSKLLGKVNGYEKLLALYQGR